MQKVVKTRAQIRSLADSKPKLLKTTKSWRKPYLKINKHISHTLSWIWHLVWKISCYSSLTSTCAFKTCCTTNKISFCWLKILFFFSSSTLVSASSLLTNSSIFLIYHHNSHIHTFRSNMPIPLNIWNT